MPRNQSQSARKPFSLTALLAATTRFSSRFVMMAVSGSGFAFPSTTSREYCARCVCGLHVCVDGEGGSAGGEVEKRGVKAHTCLFSRCQGFIHRTWRSLTQPAFSLARSCSPPSTRPSMSSSSFVSEPCAVQFQGGWAQFVSQRGQRLWAVVEQWVTARRWHL